MSEIEGGGGVGREAEAEAESSLLVWLPTLLMQGLTG